MPTVAQEPRNVIYGLSCTCHPDRGIRYVGQTALGLRTRLTNHRAQARFGTDSPVYRWIRKHGPGNIQGAVLEEIDTPQLLDEAERRWIGEIGIANLLNIAVGGKDGTTLGRKRPEFSEMIRGDNSPARVLCEADVRQIRQEYTGARGEVRSLAVQYGVTDTTVSDILQGKTWRHVPLGQCVPASRRPKMLPDEVRAIRMARDAGAPVAQIADEHGVTVQAIYAIVNRTTWRDVD